MTPAFKVFSAWAGIALVVGLLAWGLSHQRNELASARQAAEAAQLALKNQIVASSETRRELQGSVDDLLAKNSELRAAYAEARVAAPSARPTGVASLQTASLTVAGPPGPVMPPECQPDEILWPVGGSFRCGPRATPPAAPESPQATCVLSVGDQISLSVDEVVLTTDRGNQILTGAARATRERPVPRFTLAEGRFQSAVSSTASLAEPTPPRWGVEVLGKCQREGCGPGLGVLFPPFTLPLLGWRAEARAGALAGPGWSALGGVGVRF